LAPLRGAAVNLVFAYLSLVGDGVIELWCNYLHLSTKGANNCMIGERLKYERERLGMTQPDFADAAGTKKRTLIDWEKGVSSPTAVQLSALSTIGVDVLYVLTGQRAQSVTAAPALSREEEVLLDNYRNSPPAGQAAIKAASDALAQPKSKNLKKSA
jgi:transcriptional regulator with XRE-family HTH domain